jgi:hypothetical protein
MRVILAEWSQYPIRRSRRLGDSTVECGIQPLLENVKRWPPGVDDFRVRVVINHSPPDGRRGLAAHLRRLWQVASADAEEDSLTTRLAWYAGLPDRFPFVESVLLRPNSSMDIGAYDHGYRALVREGYDGEVLFMNSSAVGPFQPGWLHRYLEPLRAHDAVGLCGISLNSHDTSRCPASFDPHVQSFFLLSHMRVLKQSMGPQLLSRRLGDKLGADLPCARRRRTVAIRSRPSRLGTGARVAGARCATCAPC